MRKLASELNAWSERGEATLLESRELVIVSALSVANAKWLLEHCVELGWICSATDNSDTAVAIDDIDEAIAPVRVDIHKPEQADGSYLCVTDTGFVAFLEADPTTSATIYVATLDHGFKTGLSQYVPWGQAPEERIIAESQSPRELVKSFGGTNPIPTNINAWLLEDIEVIKEEQSPTLRIWARFAARNLLYAISSEINVEDGWLDFLGPPKFRTDLVPDDTDLYEELTKEGFLALHEAAKWVYLDKSASEQRHTYLAAEFARSCFDRTDLANHIKRDLLHALESAKIAYRLGLSEISVSTLSALTQLRKTVSDETTKLSDNTRQMATSILGSVASGIALIILRLNTHTNSYVILAIATTIFVYLVWVCRSGWQFIKIQRSLRIQWKQRLYRFLTDSEYISLVEDPIEKAEKAYRTSMVAGILCAVLLVLAVIWSVFCSTPVEQATMQLIEATSKEVSSPYLMDCSSHNAPNAEYRMIATWEMA